MLLIVGDIFPWYFASVAQWIEQWFPEPCAGGSSPSRCVTVLYRIISCVERKYSICHSNINCWWFSFLWES